MKQVHVTKVVIGIVIVLSSAAPGQIAITNGANIDMTGSTGSQIIFPDGSVLDSAEGSVPDGHGGTNNTLSGADAFIGGGVDNSATGTSSVIAGGAENAAGDTYATVGGGWLNDSANLGATIAGGTRNTAVQTHTTVAGGFYNDALGQNATVGGGRNNIASGYNGVVPGGKDNSAAGAFSFAAGRRAKAAHDGSFVFADQTNADFSSAIDNEFAVRATGGARIITSTGGAGVKLGPGASSWSSLSSKASKENMADVDPGAILEKVAAMPVQKWNYVFNDDSVKHIGPYAEDFHAAFGLNGEYDGRIATQDLDGVALAAIQGVNQKLEREVAELRGRLAELEARLAVSDE